MDVKSSIIVLNTIIRGEIMQRLINYLLAIILLICSIAYITPLFAG
jgi:hypothetical protein